MVSNGRKLACLQVFIDAVVYVAVIVLMFACFASDVFTVDGGFFCSDNSIRYPFQPTNTVSGGMLIGCGLGVPFGLMLALECMYACKAAKAWAGRTSAKQFSKVFGLFLFGWSLTMLITAVTKCATGRPRPHFIDLCQPDWDNIDCSLGYITNFTCTNDNATGWLLINARQSFPSGHASSAAFSCLYLAMYLRERMRPVEAMSVLLAPMVEALLAMVAVVVSATRVTDHWHHTSDVVGGALLGVVVALWLMSSHKKHLLLIYKQPKVQSTILELTSPQSKLVLEDSP